MRLNCTLHPDSSSRPSEADINSPKSESAGALTKAAFQPVIVIVIQTDENSLTGHAARAAAFPWSAKPSQQPVSFVNDFNWLGGRVEGRDPRAQFPRGFSKR